MQKLSERQSTELPGPTSMAAVHKRMKRRSQRDRARLDQYASQVMDLDSSGESFVQRMHRLFAEAGARHVLQAHACCLHQREHGEEQSVT